MYLEIKDLKKSYESGESRIMILKGISTHVDRGNMCVIQGPSGSGKSTFLNCIGGLDLPDAGSIKIEGDEIVGLSPDKLSEYRRDKLGFIFQFYNLVPNLTVRENIEVCQYLTKHPLDMGELLDVLGLTDYQNKFPSQLSGGQQQRCIRTNFRPSSQAASNSDVPLLAHSSRILNFSCAMNRPVPSIPRHPEAS